MPVTEQVAIPCPECEQEISFTRVSGFDGAKEPELQERLFEGELNRIKCTSCDFEEHYFPDFVYEDSKLDFAVALYAAEDADGFYSWVDEYLSGEAEAIADAPAGMDGIQRGKRRIVASIMELFEKVMIFEAGLDDRVVELVKLAVHSHFAEEQKDEPDLLLFDSIEEEDGARFCAFAAQDEAGETWLVRAPFTIYEEFTTHYADELAVPPGADWEIIDEQYALGLVSDGDEDEDPVEKPN